MAASHSHDAGAAAGDPDGFVPPTGTGPPPSIDRS